MPEIGGEIGKDRILGGLLKTGQTTQYGGYEDDGYFEKGLSKRYTVLTTGQYSGTTNITINLKTDAHSNNCVYDGRTKLMWSRYVAATIGIADDGKLPWITLSADEGLFNFCLAANVGKLGGYSDWRIPNIFELFSLCDMEITTAAPDAVAFPGWPTSGPLWSSTTIPTSIGSAMDVSFNTGRVSSGLKGADRFVALVRGG